MSAARSSANTADRYGFPDDTYAGLSTKLGYYGGGRINATTGRYTRLRDADGKALDVASPIAVSADGRTLLIATGQISGTPAYATMPAGNGLVRGFLRRAYSLTVQPSWQP